MRSQAMSLAIWAFIGLFLLCLPPIFYTDFLRSGHRASPKLGNALKRSPQGQDRLQVRGDDVFHSAGHHIPGKAPAVPAPNLSATSLAPRGLHHLDRRAALRCDDAPCVDGSCCSNDKICGFGPTYCGEGNCTSQCEALAMCGKYSEDADMPCGMDLCCSAMGWCGTTAEYCYNADPVGKTLPCQAGYGSCYIHNEPGCSVGGGNTGGRTIGYYQSWNVRERACNKVSPNQLDTTGYTHLFYAFAAINKDTFEIEPAHNDDLDMMKEFTDLANTGKLQTWIAVGGFDFSDPDRETHTTWSDMVSTKENRGVFIESVRRYMIRHGFTGVDLDWEYPGAPERGGRKLADTKNFALLLKEMRGAYGDAFGISLTLAPDYWYLRWFDAKAMEPYVDFFGFMAYDLHGSWDADVKALGKLVRGQADIREIGKNVVPLWFDNLDPRKINIGLATYGRGYTLADPNCDQLLCPFAGPSEPANCTNFPGVMSLVEINQLINATGIRPQYNAESMMKQITWPGESGMQWIGYDDDETFTAKKAWADSKCFGGTMVWSIDFQVAGSGGLDENTGQVVYLSPEVYSGVPAQCSPSPSCTFVLAPSVLPSATTITIPPYTTSLQFAPGTTTTIVVTIPPITTTKMDFYNLIVTSGQNSGTFVATPSISIPPIVTTLTGPGGVVQTRTIILPPWPSITNGPPGEWNQPSGPWHSTLPERETLTFPPLATTAKPPFTHPGSVSGGGSGTATITTTYVTVVQAVRPTTTVVTFPPTVSRITRPCDAPFTLPGGSVLELLCQGQTTFDFACPPTQVLTFRAPETVTLTKDCTAFIGVKTTDNSGPTGIPWPFGTLRPVPTEVPEGGESDDGNGAKSTCKLWFFGVCIKWGDIDADFNIKIGGWRWPPFPPGIYGPGPPPPIEFPPGIQLYGTLPPWPKITIGIDLKPTFAPKPTDCEPQTASLCMTVTKFGTTLSNGATKTTATQVKSTCDTIEGCKVKDRDDSSTIAPACTITPKRDVEPESPLKVRGGSRIVAREFEWLCGELNSNDGIIWPADGTEATQVPIRALLEERERYFVSKGIVSRGWREVRAHGLGFTAFYYLKNMGPVAKAYFSSNQVPQVYRAFWFEVDIYQRINRQPITWKRSEEPSEHVANATVEQPPSLVKRASASEISKVRWHLSQLSIPPNVAWDRNDGPHQPQGNRDEAYYFDDSLGRGQTIYLIDTGINENHAELQNIPGGFRRIPMALDGMAVSPPPRTSHGTLTAIFAVGRANGIARNAELVFVPLMGGQPQTVPIERVLEALVAVANDLEGKPTARASVSWQSGLPPGVYDPWFYDTWGRLMLLIKERYDVSFVAASGNAGGTSGVDVYPGLFANYIPGMLIVGASNIYADRAPFSQRGEDVYAPGLHLVNPTGVPEEMGAEIQGTSFAAPQVAALVAYLRGNPNYQGQRDAISMRNLVRQLSRPLSFRRGAKAVKQNYPDVNIIWNGQSKLATCAVLSPPAGAARMFRRQDGDSCPLPGGGGGGNDPKGPTVSFKPGPAGPTCTANCGKLCTGYYCTAAPTGTPPDFPRPTTTQPNTPPEPTPPEPTPPEPTPPEPTPPEPTPPAEPTTPPPTGDPDWPNGPECVGIELQFLPGTQAWHFRVAISDNDGLADEVCAGAEVPEDQWGPCAENWGFKFKAFDFLGYVIATVSHDNKEKQFRMPQQPVRECDPASGCQEVWEYFGATDTDDCRKWWGGLG